jgi:hypothetical protein
VRERETDRETERQRDRETERLRESGAGLGTLTGGNRKWVISYGGVPKNLKKLQRHRQKSPRVIGLWYEYCFARS